MFNYKKLLVVVFDKNKSNKALKEVKEILSANNIDHNLYDDSEDANQYDHIDLVLVIGGDGSMLSAAKLFSHLNCPFLGVNLGKVGFMADLDSENLIYRKRADGLIISTSNGSTAYSLSAGGPILSPEVDAFVITALNPLSLSARPLIVPSSSNIAVKLTKTPKDLKSFIIIDGNQEIKIEKDVNNFQVTKSNHNFRLLHPKNHDFFKTCRDKLNWSLSKDENSSN